MQYMRPAFRNASLSFSRALNPNPHNPLFLITLRSLPIIATSPSPSHLSSHFTLETFPPSSPPRYFSSSSMAGGGDHSAPPSFHSLEKQFEDFRLQLEESGGLRDRIRTVVSEIESTTRLMHASLLLVHQSRPTPELLEKAKSYVNALKDHYKQLAEVLGECSGQYYRYHGDWRTETQTVVSLITFMHWLETGNLLMHAEAEEKLGCMSLYPLVIACQFIDKRFHLPVVNSSEFGLDIEDYLIGVCFMSNELPRYVVNQVTAGDYDCPRKVLKFLTELHAAFRMLNLRNDFLRKKFDGMKYDLRRVEEVYYDVKIRGLAPNGEPVEDQGAQVPP